MADHLDDFFAKKDKKKKDKVKPKFLTAEELVKNLEESKREAAAAAALAKAKKPEPVVPAAASSTVTSGDEPIVKAVVEEPHPTEEEWKEFEEEQRKDYTGLKIGQMALNDEDEQSSAEGFEEEGDSEGNLNTESGKRSGGGPWKKVIPAEDVTQIPIEVEKPSLKGVYISPAMRHIQNLTPGSRLKPRNRAAPDITNSDYFPTLGAARPEEQRKKKNEPAFEEVRHGGRVQRIQEQHTTVPASVTNRFQSLDEDDS